MVVCTVRRFPPCALRSKLRADALVASTRTTENSFGEADASCESFYRSCYETPAETARSFRISSLRCKLVNLTCALRSKLRADALVASTRTTENSFGEADASCESFYRSFA